MDDITGFYCIFSSYLLLLLLLLLVTLFLDGWPGRETGGGARDGGGQGARLGGAAGGAPGQRRPELRPPGRRRQSAAGRAARHAGRGRRGRPQRQRPRPAHGTRRPEGTTRSSTSTLVVKPNQKKLFKVDTLGLGSSSTINYENSTSSAVEASSLCGPRGRSLFWRSVVDFVERRTRRKPMIS